MAGLGSLLGGAAGGPWGIGLGLLGAGMGLFGQKSNGGDPYFGQQQAALSGLGNIGSQYGQMAGQQLGQYQNDNSQYRQAAGDLANYYKTNPFTSTRDTAQLNNATAGTTNAYLNANAQLSSQMGQRGFDPNSSMMAGGLASNANNYQREQAGAQNELAYNRIGQLQSNMQNLTGLEGGLAGQDYSNGMGALGAQSGIEGELAGQYGALGNQNQARTDMYNSGLSGGIGSLIGGLGSSAGYASVLGGGGYPGGINGGINPAMASQFSTAQGLGTGGYGANTLGGLGSLLGGMPQSGLGSNSFGYMPQPYPAQGLGYNSFG